MSETPEQWAKRMYEMTQETSQFCLQAFIDRYQEREKDYGPVKCYGPFTDEELDEYDIAHGSRVHIAEEVWIFSFDFNATNEELLQSLKGFIKEQRPKEYDQYRKSKG